MESIKFDFKYEWEPFTLQSRHLTFREHSRARLSRADCSHWGAAVYKWEGLLAEGEHAGDIGVLIGETSDLRQRIKQYVSGTQKSGNKYWREQFLSMGNVKLYVLAASQIGTRAGFDESLMDNAEGVASNSVRLILEQLLVSREVARRDQKRWVVNRKL